MTKQRTAWLALSALVLAGQGGAAAGDFGTAQQARAMLERAIAEVRTDKRAAIEKFNHNNAGFRDRDLFVFCLDVTNGKFTAHEAMVTHDVREFRDIAGAPVGERILRNAREGEIVEISYLWPIPGSTETATKLAYVARAGDEVCGVSAYRDAVPGRGN